MARYTPGQSVYIDNRFAGQYVERLSDPLMSDDDMHRIVNSGAYGIYICPGDLAPEPYYGLRKAFSEDFGTVEQALINFLGQFPSWINLPANAVITPN